MSGRYTSNDRYDDGRQDYRYGRDDYHGREDYDDRDRHDRRDPRDRSHSPRGGYGRGRGGYGMRGGYRGSSRDYYGRSGSYYNYYRNNDNNNSNNRHSNGNLDGKEDQRGKQDNQEQKKEVSIKTEEKKGSGSEGTDDDGFTSPPKNKTAKQPAIEPSSKGKLSNDNKYAILEQKVDMFEVMGEKLLKKIEQMTPVKKEEDDEVLSNNGDSKGENKSGGGSSKRKRKQKKAGAKKQLATKLELVEEEEAEDVEMAEADQPNPSKRKSNDEGGPKSAKKSKTPVKATPTGKAGKKNSFGQEITPFLRDLSIDQKSVFQNLLDKFEKGELLAWPDFQASSNERYQVAMAVNLAVLVSSRRAARISLTVDINKLHAYFQFTAKVNLPKIINDEEYCLRQIKKVAAKGDNFSLLPTELTVKEYPNLYGSTLLKKLLDQPSRDDILDAIDLFIKRGWMDDPDFALERIQQSSFNELKRMITVKGSVHKFFKDNKVDVTYTPPFQFNFESALDGTKADDMSEEEDEVVVESDRVLKGALAQPPRNEDTTAALHEAATKEKPFIVEGVLGNSRNLDPALAMGIDPDVVVQLLDTKQRALIIPKLRRYLMDIAPNHITARGELLNSIPTEKLITFLHPVPLLEFLAETGTFNQNLETSKAQPPLPVISQDNRMTLDESDTESNPELFVSRMYLRSKTIKGQPGVHEPPSSVLQGLLHVASSLLKENGQVMHLLPFNSSSGVGPLDISGDMGIVTTKELLPYFGKVIAEQDGKFIQVTDQQVREGATWKQLQFKTSSSVKSLYPLTTWKASTSHVQPLKEWLQDKNLATGAHETWKSGDTERELWLLAELDEFSDPLEVKAELMRRTGLTSSHFKVQEAQVSMDEVETVGLCIVGNMLAEDEIDYKMNRFHPVSRDEAPLTYDVYPVRTRMSCLETGTKRTLLSRLAAHQKYIETRVVVKFTGIPPNLSPHTVPNDSLGITPTPIGSSNNASIASLASSIQRQNTQDRSSPIKRIVQGNEQGVWLVVGVESDAADLKKVCLELLAKLQQWAKVDSIRVDFGGLISARQEELDRKRAEAATPSKLAPITPTSILSNQMTESLQLKSTEKEIPVTITQRDQTASAEIEEMKASIGDIKGILMSLMSVINSGHKPHAIITDGTTSASSITTTLENLQASILAELKSIKEAVNMTTEISTAANDKIENVRKGYDIESIILSRVMFGEPLLEMIDNAIKDHPDLEDHMTPDGMPIAPHYHPPELAEELNKIPFDTLESLMHTSQDFVKMRGAMLCQVCLKSVDRAGTTLVVCEMCEAPYHLQCHTCVTYTGDAEGRMMCRQCRNIRRQVLAVELIKQCPICFGYAKNISERMITIGTTAHVRHRFRSLEIAKSGLISDEAFKMLSRAEEVVMGAEMQGTHNDSRDPELDESILNSSLLRELDKSPKDIDMPQAPTQPRATAPSPSAQNKIMQATDPLDQSRDSDLKPAAKAPPESTPASMIKPRAIFTDAIKPGHMAKVEEAQHDKEMDTDEEQTSIRDEQGILAGRKDNLGRMTPPFSASMETSESEESKLAKSSGSKSVEAQESDHSVATAEREYEKAKKKHLKHKGTKVTPRRSKRLQDDGFKAVDDEEEVCS